MNDIAFAGNATYQRRFETRQRDFAERKPLRQSKIGNGHYVFTDGVKTVSVAKSADGVFVIDRVQPNNVLLVERHIRTVKSYKAASRYVAKYWKEF